MPLSGGETHLTVTSLPDILTLPQVRNFKPAGGLPINMSGGETVISMAVVQSQECPVVGIRPFDPWRDARAVTELIADAFQGQLGPDGEAALAEMRRIARWGPLLGWYSWSGGRRSSLPPGFVWVNDGQVLGNLSIRPAIERDAYIIGNVAVHPDHRRKGIARMLMEMAIAEVIACGGRWIGLEVRGDNTAARSLYEQFGFREVGRTVHMLRPADLKMDLQPDTLPGLRPARREDHTALLNLVYAVVPPMQRPLLELRRADYRLGWERRLDVWLAGQREAWWVAEVDGVLQGAVRAVCHWSTRRRFNRMEVLVRPTYTGRFEDVLVRQGVAWLCSRPWGKRGMIEVVLPSPSLAMIQALEAHGFEMLRVLIQMRLNVAPRPL